MHLHSRALLCMEAVQRNERDSTMVACIVLQKIVCEGLDDVKISRQS